MDFFFCKTFLKCLTDILGDILISAILWVRCCVQFLSHVQLFVILWTVACQAPLSMEFPRQEYWSGVAISVPRVLLTQGSNPHVLRLLISRQILYHWATKEVPCVPSDSLNNILHSQDCVLENGSQDRNGGQSGYSKDRGGGKEILIAKVHLKDQPTVTFS